MKRTITICLTIALSIAAASQFLVVSAKDIINRTTVIRDGKSYSAHFNDADGL